MEIIALHGPSGTGKSHKAIWVTNRHDCDAIIDDGLFIKDRRIIAGTSAKSEPNKILAVKKAIFLNPDEATIIKRAIKDTQPERILVLGTSKKMVNRIVNALDLPPISLYIDIEEITTEAERDEASHHRLKEGKHIVPVPTVELKPHSQGKMQIIPKIKEFFGKERPNLKPPRVDGKSIVRPVFSLYGKLIIDDVAVKGIVQYTLITNEAITKVTDILIDHIYRGTNEKGYVDEGIDISASIVIKYGKHIPTLVQEIQELLANRVQEFTDMTVRQVNIKIKALFVEPKK